MRLSPSAPTVVRNLKLQKQRKQCPKHLYRGKSRILWRRGFRHPPNVPGAGAVFTQPQLMLLLGTTRRLTGWDLEAASRFMRFDPHGSDAWLWQATAQNPTKAARHPQLVGLSGSKSRHGALPNAVFRKHFNKTSTCVRRAPRTRKSARVSHSAGRTISLSQPISCHSCNPKTVGGNGPSSRCLPSNLR